MKTISRWMHENQFLIDNDRNFLISITDPCDNSKFGDPTSWELLLMGFSGCVSSVFVKTAHKENIFFSDLTVEVKMNRNSTEKPISFDIILRIKTAALQEKIQICLDNAIIHCPLGILTSTIDIPINTHVIIDNNIIRKKPNDIKSKNIRNTFLQ